MNRDTAVALLDELHAAQNEFHAGGLAAGLERLLARDVVWTVPGDNLIAGSYHGHEEVLDYFRRRRDIASGTYQIVRRDVLTGSGDRIAALSDGSATINGRDRQWSTVGVYDVVDRQIAACWLLPLGQPSFDDIWGVRPAEAED